jgi:hypothetical protein
MVLTKERKQSILRTAYEENKAFKNLTFDEFLEYYDEWKHYSTMESLENYIRLRTKKNKLTEDLVYND